MAPQYPAGTITLFQSFIGIPYKLHIWERFIELPINFRDPLIEEELIINFDFTKKYWKEIVSDFENFTGWGTLISVNGADLPATEGDGFEFIFANVPSDVTYEPPSTIGTLHATETQWQDGTCPNPEEPLMYLSGQGAKFSMAVLVDPTSEYTVEFWFKADTANYETIKAANTDATTGVSTTFLYMMSGQELSNEVSLEIRAKDVMAIYIEDGKLMCAPFGYKQEGAENTVLEYDLGGVDPLTVDGW